MQRVVVLGRGGAGKSTAAVELGRITGLQVVELDEHFWGPDLAPLSVQEWTRRQQELAAGPRWIMDGDHCYGTWIANRVPVLGDAVRPVR